MSKLLESLDDLIARYGHPFHWDQYTRIINTFRLLNEEILIRVMIDTALHCPVPEGKQLALDKLHRNVVDLEDLDKTWPGRGDFTYDWEALCSAEPEVTGP